MSKIQTGAEAEAPAYHQGVPSRLRQRLRRAGRDGMFSRGTLNCLLGESKNSFNLRGMFRSILFVACVASITVINQAYGNEPITDPIADYLAMDVPDRVSNAGHLLIIKRVEVDLEGNGKNEIFVGT